MSNTDNSTSSIARQMYEEVNYFYEYLLDSITPDDYERMSEALEYEESYEEHISSLKEGIPPPHETMKQIKNFLAINVEFNDQEYVDILKMVNNMIQRKRDIMKVNAFQTLVKHHEIEKEKLEAAKEELEQLSDVINNEREGQERDLFLFENSAIARYERRCNNQEKGIIKIRIGPSVIELDTFHNPLLSCLYGTLYNWFSLKLTGQPPIHLD